MRSLFTSGYADSLARRRNNSRLNRLLAQHQAFLPQDASEAKKHPSCPMSCQPSDKQEEQQG